MSTLAPQPPPAPAGRRSASSNPAPAPPRVQCYTSLEAASVLRHAVNALNAQSDRPDPFSTFEYLENFAPPAVAPDAGRLSTGAAAADAPPVRFLAVFRDDQLLGYLAMQRVTRRFFGQPCQVLTALVSHHGEGPRVVARPEHRTAVWHALLRHLRTHARDCSLLEFPQQERTSPLLHRPGILGVDGFLRQCWPSLPQCSIALRWPTPQAYALDLPKKFRTNLRRQMRLLLDAGPLQLRVARDPAATARLFPWYCRIGATSWKAQAGIALSQQADQFAYFCRLLHPSQPLAITVRVLLLDGAPIAGLITGQFGDTQYALDVVYDQRIGHLGAGSALLLLGVCEAITGGLAGFNLLAGSAHYKLLWRADIRETAVVQFYRIGGLPFWSRLGGNLLRRLGLLQAGLAAGRSGLRANPLRRALPAAGGDGAGARAGGTGGLTTVLTTDTGPAGSVLAPVELAAARQLQETAAPWRAGDGDCLGNAAIGDLMAFLIDPQAPPAGPVRPGAA